MRKQSHEQDFIEDSVATPNRRASRKLIVAVRWSARFWSLLVFGLLGLIIIGEGGLGFWTFAGLSAMQSVNRIMLIITWLGYAVGWRREGLGGIMIVGGTLGWLTTECLNGGHVSFNWGIVVAIMPGVLFLISYCLKRSYSKKQGA